MGSNVFVNYIQGMRDFYSLKQEIRHCKVVATIGPASSDEKTLANLIKEGLDVARLNFSHGEHKTHSEIIRKIRELSQELGRNVAILQDLQGPKIRCGKLISGKAQIIKNQKYFLSYGEKQKNTNTIPIDYKELAKDTSINDEVIMDDGLIRFYVTGKKDQNIEIQALNSGLLKNRKGVNFPNTYLSLPSLTEKDIRDLLFGISQNVDAIALSFVQSAEDIINCRKMITALGSDTPIIAKIEKLSAIKDINKISEVSDGLMVARGDLGVEGRVEKVPVFQRKIIATGAKYSKPVIIATQMLETMTNNPRPSLAEVADVANGVLEGADCIMLSGEVAAGKYPCECVRTLVSIIKTVEAWSLKSLERYDNSARNHHHKWEKHEAIARAACEAADSIKAKAIICLTLTGSIARIISSWRPKTPIIAISPRSDVVQRLCFNWGIYGMRNPLFYDTDILLQELPQLLKKLNIVTTGDKIVITAGIPMNAMCQTNMIKINEIK